jgi:hypothetical protein
MAFRGYEIFLLVAFSPSRRGIVHHAHHAATHGVHHSTAAHHVHRHTRWHGVDYIDGGMNVCESHEYYDIDCLSKKENCV